QEITDALDRTNLGTTPLGIPLLPGPGAITTVMILVANPQYGVPDQMLIYAACALVFVASFVLLLAGERLFSLLGRSGLHVFTRVMGLILAALAVQFVINGVREALPGLAGLAGIA